MSSNKKKRVLIQCHACGSYCLAKDIDAHDRQIQQQSNGSPTAEGNGTPKQGRQQQHHRRPPVQKRRSQTVGTKLDETTNETSTTAKCDGRGFLQAEYPLIEPHKGIALSEETAVATDPVTSGSGRDTDKWAQYFPMELHGHQRRQAALVHPEVLDALGAPARSAFLMVDRADDEHEQQQYRGRTVITLWPCLEIPLMRVALPTQLKSADVAASKSRGLIRLKLVQQFMPPLTHLLLQPVQMHTALPLHCWTKLAKFAHFPYFLRSYFANAILADPADQSLLEVLYYGHHLSFQIVQYECQQQQPGMVEGFELEQKMRECTLTNGGTSSRENEPISVTAQSEQQNGHANIQENANVPIAHRISPFCKFTLDWSAIPIEEDQTRQDDPESLL